MRQQLSTNDTTSQLSQAERRALFNQEQAHLALSSLKDLLKKEMSTPIQPNFLEQNQSALITPDCRHELFMWMLELSSECKLKVETLQRAYAYVDVMLSTVTVEKEAFKVIGTSSLILASKNDENRELCDNLGEYLPKIMARRPRHIEPQVPSWTDVMSCEKFLLQFCSWRTLIPVPTEFLKLLLFIANQQEAFTEVIDKTNEYIFMCLVNYQIASIFTFSTIALACLIAVLEDLDFLTFAQGIIAVVETYDINFQLEKVAECKYIFRCSQGLIDAEDQDSQSHPFQPSNDQDTPLETQREQTQEAVDTECAEQIVAFEGAQESDIFLSRYEIEIPQHLSADCEMIEQTQEDARQSENIQNEESQTIQIDLSQYSQYADFMEIQRYGIHRQKTLLNDCDSVGLSTLALASAKDTLNTPAQEIESTELAGGSAYQIGPSAFNKAQDTIQTTSCLDSKLDQINNSEIRTDPTQIINPSLHTSNTVSANPEAELMCELDEDEVHEKFLNGQMNNLQVLDQKTPLKTKERLDDSSRVQLMRTKSNQEYSQFLADSCTKFRDTLDSAFNASASTNYSASFGHSEEAVFSSAKKSFPMAASAQEIATQLRFKKKDSFNMPFSMCEDISDEDEDEKSNDVSRDSQESNKTKTIQKQKKLSPSSRTQSFKKKRAINNRTRSSRQLFALASTSSTESNPALKGRDHKRENGKCNSMVNMLNLTTSESFLTNASSSINEGQRADSFIQSAEYSFNPSSY